MTRYYGCYASRTRGMRRRQAAGGAEVEEPVVITEPVDWSLRAARLSTQRPRLTRVPPSPADP